MKKALLITLCAALLASCAPFAFMKPVEINPARAAAVGSVIAEAKSLQALAKAQGIEVPADVNSIISSAENKNSELKTEEAFILADKAILQLQLSLLKKEKEIFAVENRSAAEKLESLENLLEAYRNVLRERKGMPKEQVIL